MKSTGTNLLESDRFFEEFQKAVAYRRKLVLSDPLQCCRLFNGFYEGNPAFSLDLFAATLVIQSYSEGTVSPENWLAFIQKAVNPMIPGIKNVLLKEHFSNDIEKRNGTILSGGPLDERIREWGVEYAIDLQLNRDSGFYLDNALLRKWLIDHCEGKRVLNTFSYTGSLGMAALAGGATRIVQTDLNEKFLNQFHKTAEINGVSAERYKNIAGDFFKIMALMRKEEQLFDIVILDPPFYSKTRNGIVDLQKNFINLINKIRPLVADGGKIIAINNALYVSGSEMMDRLEEAFDDGYIQIDERIPVPESFYGGDLSRAKLPADPFPFNHPTKIVTLNVKRKDGRR